MAVKVSFEIGHTAKLKSKKTPEGFTHDWELYVRGVDKCDISHFVDKVVFNLHDSFPKPKRIYKEAPYILKESGYAGFVLPVDIYFKNRDDPKRVTYQYDLDLQTTGPPAHRSVIKKFVFNNPSDEFKQKLLKGGGTLLMMNYDEKSRDSIDERSQTSNSSNKTKTTNDTIIKKNKIRPEDSKMQTFATVFGPPITKTTTKVSPDPKSKGSPSLMTSSNKGNNKITEKSSSLSSGSGSGSMKDKNEKGDKKDKHRRNSPHRDRDASKDSRKISNDEKHERKDDKNTKEKSHSKDRDHSKDRTLKRPASPKRLPPSPKRSSPSRNSSVNNRSDENISKQIKSEQDGKKASSNSSKKSKKDKKSHEKDKDRERKERDRERKDKDERSNSSNPPISSVPSNLNHPISGNPIKSNIDTKIEITKKTESGQLKDVKDIKKTDGKVKENATTEKKILEKQDKDTEKKHKHKKKEKSKEKDKEKELSSKEKKKEKNNKLDVKKASSQQQQQPSPQLGGIGGDTILLSGQQKSTSAAATAAASNTTNNAINKQLSDQDSSDTESENLGPQHGSESKSNNNHSDTSNSSFPDLMIQKPSSLTHYEGSKADKKDHKSRGEKLKMEKNGKKRKRKSKDDQEQSQPPPPPPPQQQPQQPQPIRKSVSPIVNNTQITVTEAPPNKQFKKEDYKIDNNKINSPALISSAQNTMTTTTTMMTTTTMTTTTTTTMPQESSPRIGNNNSPVFRTPSSTSVPVAVSNNSTTTTIPTSTPMPTDKNTINVDYMSELRELQHKIMTLQDNNELQQVVEMIAATGRFEVTSKTFDFDLCALDRTTVQRLQDFLATSVS